MSKSLLLTGASSGIGASCAKHLAARGFQVFGTSRTPPQPHSPTPDSAGIRWIPMDVCDEASVDAGMARVVADAGKLDALVCNAGFGIFGSVEEVSLEAARKQFDTNFFGVLRTLRAAIPHMRRAGEGRIVVIGSLAGRAPIPFQAHYSASKAAVDALALALRNELHGTGVWVSLVEPGDIDTPFNEAMDWGEHDGSPYGERLASTERVIRASLPRAPGPGVVAQAVHHALTSTPPRVRYAVGAESTLVPLSRRLLPDWLTLRLIRSHFGF
jgi:NAD(P)-dependent dehydrogenase (short-subunit alcohol dehydrogenase family)